MGVGMPRRHVRVREAASALMRSLLGCGDAEMRDPRIEIEMELEGNEE